MNESFSVTIHLHLHVYVISSERVAAETIKAHQLLIDESVPKLFGIQILNYSIQVTVFTWISKVHNTIINSNSNEIKTYFNEQWVLPLFSLKLDSLFTHTHTHILSVFSSAVGWLLQPILEHCTVTNAANLKITLKISWFSGLS